MRRDVRKLRVPRQPPAASSDHAPDRFDQAEGPGALEETVDRAEDAGGREGENENRVASLERVENDHQRDREKPEERQKRHAASLESSMYLVQSGSFPFLTQASPMCVMIRSMALIPMKGAMMPPTPYTSRFQRSSAEAPSGR